MSVRVAAAPLASRPTYNVMGRRSNLRRRLPAVVHRVPSADYEAWMLLKSEDDEDDSKDDADDAAEAAGAAEATETETVPGAANDEAPTAAQNAAANIVAHMRAQHEAEQAAAEGH